MHDENMAILRGLVSVAWADERVSDEETEVIEALLQAFDATPSEAHEIRMYARERKQLDDIPLTDLSRDDRRVLLQHAVLIASVDGELHDKERGLLLDLCEKLKIPEVEARGLMSTAEERAKELARLL